MLKKRQCGVLLHPTSLPGSGGIGSFGSSAMHFVDFLRKAGQSVWQVLPLGPTAYGNSPYSCYSAFAGNPLLINLELLHEEGDLTKGDLKREFPTGRIDYQAVEQHKFALLEKAAASFFAGDAQERRDEFWHFCDSTFWLHDYAMFMALKGHFEGKSWCDWPAGLVGRCQEDLEKASRNLGHAIGAQKYMQWQFFRQWRRVKEYANANGVAILGDIPIFVAYDSADVWCNPSLFHLDRDGRPTVVSGVPPDYFSKTGQLWGNPLYNWENLALQGYGWWVARVRSDLALYDMARIDHFRGFEACWEVPRGEKTAVNGRWVKGPGEALFDALVNALGHLPIVAEDLGLITPEVEALRDKYRLPGMKILQFAFDSGPDNPYLPHNHIPNAVVYTGTHDNDTSLGWYISLSEKGKVRVRKYLSNCSDNLVWEMVRAAIGSVAGLAVIPMQDLLGLDSASRMNVPGVAGGNWSWRACPEDFSPKLAARLAELVEMYGRMPHS